MLAENARIILESRHTNKALEQEFDQQYSKLSPDIQKRYSEILNFPL
jgi:hypothetical protein